MTPGPIGALLREAASRRGLWPPAGSAGGRLDLPEAFLLVRDMPYARASSRAPEVTIREWRGTCSGKHYLLHAVCAELGYRAALVHCAYRIPPPPRAEAHLAALFAAGPIPDVHTFMVVDAPPRPMRVDATWPLDARRLGVTVNPGFAWGEDMDLACAEPDQCVRVPEGADPQAVKEALLRRISPDDLTRREALLSALMAAAAAP